MNSSQLRSDLPEPVRRYFLEVAQMEPPADLLDAAIADIERSPRVTRFAALPIFGFVAAAVAVAGILVYTTFVAPAPPDVGDPDASPSATASMAPTETPEPTPLPIASLPPLESLPSAGSIAATYDVGDAGYPVLYAHGSVWLSNAGTGTLTRMDPATGELTGSVVVNPDPGDTRYDLNAVADDQFVWATGTDRTVAKIDPATNEVVERVDIGTLVYRMVLRDGQLWVTNLDDNGRILRLDTATGEVVVEEFYALWPGALAVTDTDVWMQPYQHDQLHRIDPATGQSLESFDVSAHGMQVVTLGDSLYISGNQERPIERFSLSERAVMARIPEMSIATDGERIFGFGLDGVFMELDADSLQPRSALTVEGGEIFGGLFAEGQFFVAQGDPNPRIVVIDPAG